MRRLALALVVGLAPALAGAATPVTYVGAGTLRNATGNATTAFPAGYAANDICLVASSSNDAQTHSISSPAGWTQLVQGQHATLNQFSIFWRRMTSGAETAPTVTRTTSTARIIGRMWCYRGADTGINPTAGTLQANTTTAGGTLGTATPAVTTSVNNSLVLHIFGFTNVTNATAAVTSPTGINGTTYSSGFSAGGTSTTRNGLGAYSAFKTPAGSSGTSNVTTTQADKVMSVHVYLTPDTNGSATIAQQVGTGYQPTTAVAPSIVAGTPVSGTNATGTTVAATIPASTWLQNDVIVAVQANGDNTTAANAMSAAGGVLTFTSRVSAANATAGDCAIWTAVAGADQAASSVAITATDSDGSGSSRSLVVYVLRGASTSGPWTNVVSTTTGSGTAFAMADTGAASSFWPASFMGRTSATTATPNADSTEVVDYNGGGNTVWQGYNNKSLTSPSIGGTWAGTQAYVGCMMEIPGTAGGVAFGGGGGTLTQQVGTGAINGVTSSGGGGGGDATASISQVTADGAVNGLSAGGGATLASLSGTGTIGSVAGGGGAVLAQQTSSGAVGALAAGGGAALVQQAGAGALNALSASGGGGGGGDATLTQIAAQGAIGALYGGGGSAVAQVTGTGAAGSLSAGGGGALSQRSGTGAVGSLLAGGGGVLLAQVGTGAIGSLSSTGSAVATLTQVAGTGFLGTLIGSGDAPVCTVHGMNGFWGCY